MECLEFRHAAGADPQHLSPEASAHRTQCATCRRFHQEMLALDDRILAALKVAVPQDARSAEAARVVAFPLLDRRRWMALAASIAGGVMIGTLLWLSSPKTSLAEDVVRHMAHEPGVMVPTSAPADAETLERVLDRGGIRFDPDSALVSYAQSCRFRGHKVPHLVVQTDAGPVTVMVLRHEHVAAPEPFAEGGYTGTLLPAGPGAVAVLGHEPREVIDQIAQRVAAAVEWSAN